MEKERLYDIGEVCKRLGTTSRTLRFYEEKGIISSTAVPVQSRRQYTEAQVEHIRNVLVLRTLGISVKAIAALQSNTVDLRAAVLSRRAEIAAAMDARRKELVLLNEALTVIESGDDIFRQTPQTKEDTPEDALSELARRCSKAIIDGDTDVLYQHLSPKLIEYMPRESYEIARADTFAPAGKLIAIDRLERDKKHPHILYQYARYETVGIKIQLVFHHGQVAGLWMGYCELPRKGEPL
ncbi:MAG: MerR family transcriptional regulator [Clostridia bacterium]|nr:MerR family transcriptional regulator [Clostridia bacterium]